jgi:circadian clock protein KaiB
MMVLVLYIASGGPNSLLAVANLSSICAEHLKDRFRLEIVDILLNPQRALADGVLVTPSLAKVSPAPAARVVGNLSDRGTVLRTLGIMN